MSSEDPRILLAEAFSRNAAGDARGAADLARRALAAAPDAPPVLGAAAMLLAAAEPLEALDLARRLADREPANPGAYALLAKIHADLPRDVEGIATFQGFARRDLPGDARRAVLAALAALTNRAGDAAGALAILDTLGPTADREIEYSRLLYTLYARDMTDADVMALKRRYDARDPAMPVARAAARNRIPRIGFLGSNLGTINYMALLAPLLTAFDRAAFEIELIALTPIQGAMAEFYRALDLNVVLATDPARAAETVAARGIDLLIEMDDILAAAGRPALRRRPARAHASWFNMTGPAADPAYDASIGNAALYPDATAALYAETRICLPADAFVYDPEFASLRPPAPSPAPCERNGYVTFGSLAQMYKIGALCLDLWAAALRAAPAARFHLANAAMEEPAASSRFVAAMGARGIDPARITTGVEKNWPSYLRGYAKIDLAFATFPIPGGTTMFEAAWQGVPTLACRGGHALTRIGDWLAAATDAPWTACADAGAFAARAAELAADPSRLIAARREWRDRLRAKSRTDTPRVARAMEDAFRAILAVKGESA
jgi:predicted O-linked N-acetylglucosamine transferase (SPINDLY family)